MSGRKGIICSFFVNIGYAVELKFPGSVIFVYYKQMHSSCYHFVLNMISMETTKETYEAPLCTVIEVEPVQVICSSGTGSHQGFGEDDYSYGW